MANLLSLVVSSNSKDDISDILMVDEEENRIRVNPTFLEDFSHLEKHTIKRLVVERDIIRQSNTRRLKEEIEGLQNVKEALVVRSQLESVARKIHKAHMRGDTVRLPSACRRFVNDGRRFIATKTIKHLPECGIWNSSPGSQPTSSPSTPSQSSSTSSQPTSSSFSSSSSPKRVADGENSEESPSKKQKGEKKEEPFVMASKPLPVILISVPGKKDVYYDLTHHSVIEGLKTLKAPQLCVVEFTEEKIMYTDGNGICGENPPDARLAEGNIVGLLMERCTSMLNVKHGDFLRGSNVDTTKLIGILVSHVLQITSAQ